MKLTLEDTIRGMLTGRYTATPQPCKLTCNYSNDYYGDRQCQRL